MKGKNPCPVLFIMSKSQVYLCIHKWLSIVISSPEINCQHQLSLTLSSLAVCNPFIPLISGTAPLKVHTQREKNSTHTHKNDPLCNRPSSRACKCLEQILQEKIIKNLVEHGLQDLTQCDFASYGSREANWAAFLQ